MRRLKSTAGAVILAAAFVGFRPLAAGAEAPVEIVTAAEDARHDERCKHRSGQGRVKRAVAPGDVDTGRFVARAVRADERRSECRDGQEPPPPPTAVAATPATEHPRTGPAT